MKFLLICVVMLGAISSLAQSASTTGGSSSSNSSTSATTKAKTTPSSTTHQTGSTTPGTTLSPDVCHQYNGSCKDCVKHSECLYCKSDKLCKVYPKGDILPKSSLCALSDARWGVCWVNFEALIITCSVIGGVIILTITCCCVYCCCCLGRAQKSYVRDDSRYEQQKMERKVKQDERRSERKSRLDEIRRKYGLVKDDAPYQRFDA